METLSAGQDIHMDCNHMRFIIRHRPSWSTDIISVAVFGSYR